MNEIVSYPPELLTRKQVAYMLSTSEWGVSKLVRENLLVEVDDKGKWAKYRLEDVKAYVKSLKEKQRPESS